jgi:hypothetical protein
MRRHARLVTGPGHLREGAWINGRTGQWSFIGEHGDWEKRPGNLASLGLPDAVQEAIKDISNDCGGKSRKKILPAAMVAGGTPEVDATRREPK